MEFFNTISLTDWVGYLASLLVLISFLMKDIKNLRAFNSLGCFAFIVYGILLDWNYPVIITNTAILGINLTAIFKSSKDIIK
jgi:uncharacterized protein with PQ loop repeat